MPGEEPPGRLLSRVIGKAEALESRWIVAGAPLVAPAGRRPTLHLDPASVVYSDLKPADIVLCHDLGPITHPDLFAPEVTRLYRHAYARVAEKRARVVCVSRASERAFRAACGDGCETRVIYPPIRAELGRGDRPDDAGSFLLTVGSIGARKNQEASIRAFTASGLAARGWRYVLCGSHEPGAKAVIALAEATPNVRQLPYVSDAELVSLYGAASGFVLMSRLEGFGVPVAEAIGYGLVPIISRDSVLVEVAGEGALTADPSDVDGIAAAMVRLAEMDAAERRARLDHMEGSLSRFSRETFDAAWRELLTAPPAGV